MSNILKIQRAYCLELDEVISIDTARCEYFSLEEDKRKRFNFLCSDEICRFHNGTGVRVTGINYDKLCGERTDGKSLIQPAHYRKNDNHHPNCEWSINSKLEESVKPLDNESSADFAQRKLRCKLSHFINEFDPENDDVVVSSNNSGQLNKPKSNCTISSSDAKNHRQNKEDLLLKSRHLFCQDLLKLG